MQAPKEVEIKAASFYILSPSIKKEVTKIIYQHFDLIVNSGIITLISKPMTATHHIKAIYFRQNKIRIKAEEKQ